MKKFVFAALLAILLRTPAFAAIPATNVWEVRSTGAAINGGGFDNALGTGTDYSQQNAAQAHLVDGATAGADAVWLTTQADNLWAGNTINVIGGTNFTAGRYSIIAVNPGVSFTLDRAVASGVGADGECYIGGAVSNPEDIFAEIVGGNTVWVKNGTYALAAALTVTADELYFLGYNATRGDNPTLTDRPTIDGNSTAGFCMDFQAKDIYVANVIFTGSTDSNIYSVVSAADRTGIKLQNCKFTAGTAGAGVEDQNNTISLFNCESANCAGNGIEGTNNFYCHAHNNGGAGFAKAWITAASSCVGCVSWDNAGNGFYDIQLSVNCIAYDNLNGWRWLTAAIKPIAVSCISYGNGANPFSAAVTGIPGIFNWNAYDGVLDNISAGANDVALTSSPFNGEATGNFTVKPSFAGIKAGFPLTLTGIGLQGNYNGSIGLDQFYRGSVNTKGAR